MEHDETVMICDYLPQLHAGEDFVEIRDVQPHVEIPDELLMSVRQDHPYALSPHH